MGFFVHVGRNVCAVAGKQLHAADPLQISPRLRAGNRRKTLDAACGKRVKLLGFAASDGENHLTVSWPVYVDQAAEWGYERCRDCMKASPGKPKRVEFVNEKGK